MQPATIRSRARRAAAVAVALATALAVPLTDAAKPPTWLKLQASRFGVVSQLTERETRQWAAEFDDFIDAMQQIFKVDDAALRPLTVVLFAQTKGFAPYRVAVASGRNNVAGFFGNMGTWSVIGTAGSTSSDETRHIIYHEAVHWFMSADDVESPLWFEEGFAEVFSTFEVKDGKGRWGSVLKDDVDYLSYTGVQPLDEFFRVTQEQSLHGTSKFYPEAWAFVHYLLFGDNGTDRQKLVDFLKLQRENDLDTAFTTAFGKSYKDMTAELQAYLHNGRYRMAIVDLPSQGADLTVEPASPATVEFALARLAVGGGNNEIGKRHAETVIGMVPNSAAPYELLAIVADRADDHAAASAAIDKAIELGSRDSNVFRSKGLQVIEQNTVANAAIQDLLPAAAARTAADLFDRSLALDPRNRQAVEGLVTALLNVDAVTEADDQALAVSRRYLSTDGLVLVGQAAVAHQRGDASAATALLRKARGQPFTLPQRYRASVGYLHDTWLIDWVVDQTKDSLTGARSYDDGYALIDAQLADAAVTGRARTALENIKADLHGFERIHAAAVADRAGHRAEATAILTEVASDSNPGQASRRQAQQRLDRAASQ